LGNGSKDNQKNKEVGETTSEKEKTVQETEDKGKYEQK
jgi:hypothetical protein